MIIFLKMYFIFRTFLGLQKIWEDISESPIYCTANFPISNILHYFTLVIRHISILLYYYWLKFVIFSAFLNFCLLSLEKVLFQDLIREMTLHLVVNVFLGSSWVLELLRLSLFFMTLTISRTTGQTYCR